MYVFELHGYYSTLTAALDVLNYLDRNNIAAARLGTLEEDLNIVGNQYNTIISEVH